MKLLRLGMRGTSASPKADLQVVLGDGQTQGADHKVEVTLCAARHLPNVDGAGLLGIWGGSCDAFVELVCKDKTQKSTVKKNCLDQDWKPEEKFEFELSSGELADIEIQLKHWNMTSSATLLGTTVLGIDALKRLMAGEKHKTKHKTAAGDQAALPSDEFRLTAPDGKPLMGKDKQQTHLVLKVAVVEVEKTGEPMEDVVIKADKPKMQVTLYSALPHIDGDPRMLDHKEKDVFLPEGWLAVKDSKTNEYFYVHHERKFKSKVHPNFDQRKEKCIEDPACDGSLSEPVSLSDSTAAEVSSSTQNTFRMSSPSPLITPASKSAANTMASSRHVSAQPKSVPILSKKSNRKESDMQKVALSPAKQRAEEIQGMLQEARAAREAAQQAKKVKEKLAECSPTNWKSIVRQHLGAHGNKVDDIRAAREAWMLERQQGGRSGDAQGSLYAELAEMRQLLSGIAHSLPSAVAGLPYSVGHAQANPLGTSFETSHASQNSGSPLLQPLARVGGGVTLWGDSQGVQPQSQLIYDPSSPSPAAPSYNSDPDYDAYCGSYHDETPELLRDVQDLYKKVHGFYPSRQALVNFCAQSLRINILPYLPKERSRAQRSLMLNSGVVSADVSWDVSRNVGNQSLQNLEDSILQCSNCGSPVKSRKRAPFLASPSPKKYPSLTNSPTFALAPQVSPSGGKSLASDRVCVSGVSAQERRGPPRVPRHWPRCLLTDTGEVIEEPDNHAFGSGQGGGGSESKGENERTLEMFGTFEKAEEPIESLDDADVCEALTAVTECAASATQASPLPASSTDVELEEATSSRTLTSPAPLAPLQVQLQDDFPLVYQKIGTPDIFREGTPPRSVLPVSVEGEGKTREPEDEARKPDCRVHVHTAENIDRGSAEGETQRACTSPQGMHAGKTNEETCVSKNAKLDAENRGFGEKEKGLHRDGQIHTLHTEGQIDMLRETNREVRQFLNNMTGSKTVPLLIPLEAQSSEILPQGEETVTQVEVEAKRAISFQNQEGDKDVDGGERNDTNGRRNKDEWLEFEGQPAQHVMPQIARALWNSAHIQGLKMRNGGLGAIASCVSDLSRPLAVNHILVHLDLSHNEMDCLATALLATALCSNSSLQQLFLSHNRIGPNGGRHIAQALKRNKTLVLLDLSYNPLGPSGTSCVGMSLNFNTSLTTLLLRGNRGGNVAASFVAEAIKRQGTVGAHGVHGATVVPQFVQHGPLLSRSSLTHVDLSENEITDVGAQALVRALQRNPFIKSLDLDKNDIEIALVDSIRVLTRRAADTARQEGAHALAPDERTLSSDTVRIL